jgi:hypothetical protein
MKGRNPLRRRIARPLFFISVLLFVAALALYLLNTPVYPGFLLGLGILGLGLNVLLGGDIIIGAVPRQFVAKGNVVRGKAVIKAGLCDLALTHGSNSRVATVRSGPVGKPQFAIRDGVAYLQVTQPRLLKNIANWEAGLATNILWDLNLSSGLGDMVLDLSQLRVGYAAVRTRSGHVVLRLPNRGAASIDITAGMGEVEIALPPDVGARITVPPKELVNVRVENPRIQPLGIDGYVTANFERASTQIEVTVNARAADIIFSE